MTTENSKWDYTELKEDNVSAEGNISEKGSNSPAGDANPPEEGYLAEGSAFKRSCQQALGSELRNQRSLYAISITFLLIAIGVFSLLAGWYWVDIAYLHQGVSPNVVLIGMVIAMILYGVSHAFGILHKESSKACSHLRVSLKSCKLTEGETVTHPKQNKISKN